MHRQFVDEDAIAGLAERRQKYEYSDADRAQDMQYSGMVPSNYRSQQPSIAFQSHYSSGVHLQSVPSELLRSPSVVATYDSEHEKPYPTQDPIVTSYYSPESALADAIKNTFTPTGNVQDDKDHGEAWGKSVGATPANVEMMGIAASEGWNAAAKQMMANAGGDYASMRAMYG